MKATSQLVIIQHAVTIIFGDRLSALREMMENACADQIAKDNAEFLLATKGMPASWFVEKSHATPRLFDEKAGRHVVFEFVTGVRLSSDEHFTSSYAFGVAVPFTRVMADYGGVNLSEDNPVIACSRELDREIKEFSGLMAGMLSPCSSLADARKRFPEFASLLPPAQVRQQSASVPSVILTGLAKYAEVAR